MGVLKTGRSLTAPASINGTWTLETDLSRLAQLACQNPQSPLRKASLVISQSGKYLVVSLPDVSGITGSGSLEKTSLQGTVTSAAGEWREAGCANPPVLSLVARADEGAKPASLAGTLSAEHCSSCAPLEFRAVREAAADPKAAH